MSDWVKEREHTESNCQCTRTIVPPETEPAKWNAGHGQDQRREYYHSHPYRKWLITTIAEDLPCSSSTSEYTSKLIEHLFDISQEEIAYNRIPRVQGISNRYYKCNSSNFC